MRADSPSSRAQALRPACPGDLHWIAQLHAGRLPHGFFVLLGQRFLRAYYRSFMDTPTAIALVLDRGTPAGFVVGAVDAHRHRRVVMRRHGLRLALAGLAALVTRPRVASMFVRTRVMRYVRGVVRALHRSGKAAALTEPALATSVLSHVAVDTAVAGSGAGRALVEAFCDAARAAGAVRVELVTLADERGAGPFYERLGWTVHPQTSPNGFLRYSLDLP